MIKLTIPRVIPSNNQLLRMHWRDQRKLSKLWSEEIMVAKCEQLQDSPELFRELREVYVISCRKGLIQDDDNLYGGCKPVLDGLVANQLIFDDAREFCKLSVYQVQAKDGDSYTTILIRGVSGSI